MGRIQKLKILRAKLASLGYLSEGFSVFLVLAVTLLGGSWLLGGFSRTLNSPWSASGEPLNLYMQLVGLKESASTQLINGVGWPYQLDATSLNTSDWLSQGIFWVLLQFFEPFEALNFYLLLSFALIGVLTHIAFRVIGFSKTLSVLSGLILTFTPWHLQRAFTEPTQALYIAVPLFIIFIAFYLKWQITTEKRFYFYALISILLISLSTKDYWIFTLIFLTLFMIYRFIAYPNYQFRIILGTIILIFITPSSILISTLYQKGAQLYPVLAQDLNRNLQQSEAFSGSFTSLLLPSPLSGIPFMANIRNSYENLVGAVNIESYPWNSLILILAFIFSILVFLTTAFYRGKSDFVQKLDRDNLNNFLIRSFGLMFVVGLFFYWNTGLGSTFNFFLTDSIQAWGKLYIFLAYFALIITLLVLKQLEFFKEKSKNFRSIALSLVVVILLVDQAINPYPVNADAADRYQKAQSYTAALNQELEPNCPILQIPVYPYPEAGYNLYQFQDYEHFWLPLVDSSRPYSYGANKANQQFLWQNNLNSEDLEKLSLQAAAVGYCAISVDLSAYESRVEEGNRWIEALGAPVAVSSDARWAAWKVADQYTKNQVRELVALNWFGNFAAGEVQEEIQIDFYDQTFALYALNPTQDSVDGTISLKGLSGSCTPSQSVTITDTSTGEVLVQAQLNKELKEITFPVILEPREQKRFEFRASSRTCTVEWWSDTKVAFREQKFSLN